VTIRLLDSYGSGQVVTEANGPVLRRTGGLLVNHRLLIDAGRVGPNVSLEEQRRIGVLSLPHLHLNYIRELPPPADNLVGVINEPVVIAASPKTLNGSMPAISTLGFTNGSGRNSDHRAFALDRARRGPHPSTYR
jgi:hypothetical protein